MLNISNAHFKAIIPKDALEQQTIKKLMDNQKNGKRFYKQSDDAIYNPCNIARPKPRALLPHKNSHSNNPELKNIIRKTMNVIIKTIHCLIESLSILVAAFCCLAAPLLTAATVSTALVHHYLQNSNGKNLTPMKNMQENYQIRSQQLETKSTPANTKRPNFIADCCERILRMLK